MANGRKLHPFFLLLTFITMWARAHGKNGQKQGDRHSLNIITCVVRVAFECFLKLTRLGHQWLTCCYYRKKRALIGKVEINWKCLIVSCYMHIGNNEGDAPPANHSTYVTLFLHSFSCNYTQLHCTLAKVPCSLSRWLTDLNNKLAQGVCCFGSTHRDLVTPWEIYLCEYTVL